MWHSINVNDWGILKAGRVYRAPTYHWGCTGDGTIRRSYMRFQNRNHPIVSIELDSIQCRLAGRWPNELVEYTMFIKRVVSPPVFQTESPSATDDLIRDHDKPSVEHISHARTAALPLGELVTLTCPTCGARLQITQGSTRYVCDHCGNEYVVRSNGDAALAPEVDGPNQDQTRIDKAAAEMGIARLERDVAQLGAEIMELTNNQEITSPPVQNSPILKVIFQFALVATAYLYVSGNPMVVFSGMICVVTLVGMVIGLQGDNWQARKTDTKLQEELDLKVALLADRKQELAHYQRSLAGEINPQSAKEPQFTGSLFGLN